MSSVELWTYIVVGITFALYIYIGYANRVRDTKGFYVAGQGVPAVANGAATAADWMSAASFISMAGLISFMGFNGTIYLMGWTGGYVLLALLLAPYLRKFGKYTVPDFVGDRYYSQLVRVLAAIATVVISLTYVAGQMRGVGIVFSRFLGVGITTGVVIGMLIVGFFAILGGMKGITWTQVAQYAVLIVAYLIPAFAIGAVLTGNPIPQISFTFSDIIPRLNDLQVTLGFQEYTQPFVGKGMLDVFCVTLALMAGTAGLPHVITRFYTVPNVRAARYSAGWALLFIALLYTTAPAIAAFARYNLINTLDTATVANVEPGDKQDIYILNDANGQEVTWATSWQKTGLLAFVDKNNDGKIAFLPGDAFNGTNFKEPKADTANEAYFDRDIIVLANPEIAKLAPFIIALVAAGGLAAALSTASGLLLAMSSAVSHDIYYRVINPGASEDNRLMAGRIAIGVALIFAGYFGINPPGFVGQVVALAFGLAASSTFPLILLGIFDKRTNSAGATAGIIVGLLFTLLYIVNTNFLKNPPWIAGISGEGIGAIGMVLNLVVTYVVSRITAAPPQDIQDMVESVRVPRGAADAVTAH
ncbi:MAG: cation acetate symporter [Caldilineaceae bacterium]|nr:cation acetate symporter [Caldilineaceae bacterium]MCB0094282.1 cation acetate symporter [Caldilineaceae bacterium]MCB9157711.1 cation acetate symporter [Caldilineaceae bacterium]